MNPRRDAERVRHQSIDIWIGNIIVSGVDGVIFTLIFLVVTIFWKNTHTRSTILMDTQLIIAFLIGYLHALNIFLQSKNRTQTVPEGLYCRRQTQLLHRLSPLLSQSLCSDGLHARTGIIFMALNSHVHYWQLDQRITIPSTDSLQKK